MSTETKGKAVQICSISPEKIVLPTRTHSVGGYVIPACPKDKPFTSVVVSDRMDERKIYTEYDWTKAEVIPIAIPVEQIIADYFANEKLEALGCFVISADAIPTQTQIDKARKNRKAFLQRLVQEGDKEFLRTHRIDQIPDFCKRAVEELHVTREWAFQAPGEMFDCPVCAETLKVGVAVCKACGAILDKEKAAAFGLSVEQRPEPVPVDKSAKRKGAKAKEEDEIGGI